MIEQSLAQPAHETTTEERPPAYVLRGLGLFELHSEEILSSYQGAGHWLVPSGTETSKLYEVRVGARRERERCELAPVTSTTVIAATT